MLAKFKEKHPKLHKHLFTVTTFSKLLALSLFIILPFVGFYLGINYQKKVTTNMSILTSDKLNTDSNKESNARNDFPPKDSKITEIPVTKINTDWLLYRPYNQESVNYSPKKWKEVSSLGNIALIPIYGNSSGVYIAIYDNVVPTIYKDYIKKINSDLYKYPSHENGKIYYKNIKTEYIKLGKNYGIINTSEQLPDHRFNRTLIIFDKNGVSLGSVIFNAFGQEDYDKYVNDFNEIITTFRL